MLERSIGELLGALRRGDVRSRDLVEEALARIADPAGEGARTFTFVFAEEARRAADALDRGARFDRPLAGLPISVKDLFDVAGLPTTAGSVILRGAAPATHDAPVVARLRAAGAVIVGRTNMTEFAFSGIGQNPHYGIPRNPWDRATGRIPGGSSSGAAIAVTDGMSVVSIGTDTGGSVRIPAAMTGLFGWKPTARRVPREGMIPLAPTLDSVGPLARSVDDAAIVDAVMAGEEPRALPEVDLTKVRLLAPTNYVRDELDAIVAERFTRALEALRRAGVAVAESPLRALDDLDRIHRHGGLGGAESWAWHRELIARGAEQYDPRVLVRIAAGRRMTAEQLEGLHRERAAWQAAMREELRGFDAWVAPTVAIVAPRITELEEDGEFSRLNGVVLRTTFVVNFADGCAGSVACGGRAREGGEAPAGVMVAGSAGDDRAVLALAKALEPVLRAA